MSTHRFKLLLPSCVVFALAWSNPAVRAEQFLFQHEHVLGTSLEMVFECDDRSIAQQAEILALSEIDRLEGVFSTYRSDSELSRWMRGEMVRAVSADLRTVLERAEHWRIETQGAFDTRAEAVRQLYDRAPGPNSAERHGLVAQLSQAPFISIGDLKLSSDLPLSLDAIAKGYILDKVCEATLKKIPRLVGCMINIGGDLKVAGSFDCISTINDPLDHSENSVPIASLILSGNQVLATSGTYRRFVGQGSGKVPHLFDPRTALPVDRMLSVSVIADCGMDADALATAMSVMSVEESLELAERAGVACLLIDQQGGQHRSEAWPTDSRQSRSVIRLISSEGSNNRESTGEHSTKSRGGLTVDFTLAANNQGGRYRRPYVAIWLEDEEGFPVKTALLWLQTANPGPRWHRDLTRWYRNDRIRKLSEQVDLIETVSGATRGPGEYSTRFDGTDNTGQILPPGQYLLSIEVAREHGTYQIIRERFEWGANPISDTQLKPNQEISQASYRFEPVSAVQ